jgi:hypothetical protein
MRAEAEIQELRKQITARLDDIEALNGLCARGLADEIVHLIRDALVPVHDESIQ